MEKTLSSKTSPKTSASSNGIADVERADNIIENQANSKSSGKASGKSSSVEGKSSVKTSCKSSEKPKVSIPAVISDVQEAKTSPKTSAKTSAKTSEPSKELTELPAEFADAESGDEVVACEFVWKQVEEMNDADVAQYLLNKAYDLLDDAQDLIVAASQLQRK